MTITGASLKQLKVKTTGEERFEHRYSSSDVKMYSRHLKEGDHWGNLGVDGLIILGWISRRWDVGIWTGLGWPRVETGGGRL